ncbi:C-type lectin domain family 2 member D isoform X2 [Chlorocebus sabaeus]|uniref:C-type lectin domain family 2 member D isoform X2 n=1 Tax=Chlorocebus sabaeus TaxID=60711 RepID=UPI0018B036B3|nr:C-type lectin domain family 2 member D isoform X3 [Chlorocebus sabaeus]
MCGNWRAPPWSEGGAFTWSSEKSGRRRLRFDLPSVTPPGPSQLAIRANCHQKSSECLQAACPESWIGFQRKCFYFSDDTKNWTSSQRFCDSQNADLAQVESFQELNFLLRYKGPSDHWIGLSREQGQPWKWINGTEWTRQFPILGAGECAYLNDKGASSARYYTERKWICSKPDTYVQMLQQSPN